MICKGTLKVDIEFRNDHEIYTALGYLEVRAVAPDMLCYLFGGELPRGQ